MYVCGPTLYDELHIGNARSLLVYDVLFRFLQVFYQKVTYVRNITDIDDKIIIKAQQLGTSCEAVVKHNANIYYQQLKALNILPPTHEPRATNAIGQIAVIINQLRAKGLAYAKAGHVFFRAREFSSYGALSRRDLAHNKAGRGRELLAQDLKEDPNDFVLWKPSKEGEPTWTLVLSDRCGTSSARLEGRPGWHIECSAMIAEHLGPTIDIHGGGIDLMFPHHENERAQSMGAFGCKNLARYWVHNAFVRSQQDKMSKSLGNVVSIAAALESHHPEVLRVALLRSHYRKEIEFSSSTMGEAQAILDNLYKALNLALEYLTAASAEHPPAEHLEPKVSLKELGSADLGELKPLVEQFLSALGNDLDTYSAFRCLHQMSTLLTQEVLGTSPGVTEDLEPSNLGASQPDTTTAEQTLVAGGVPKSKVPTATKSMRPNHLRLPAMVLAFCWCGALLGILRSHPTEYLKSRRKVTPAEVEALIKARNQARLHKDYAASDQIRNQLLALGVEVMDLPGGKTEWRYL